MNLHPGKRPAKAYKPEEIKSILDKYRLEDKVEITKEQLLAVVTDLQAKNLLAGSLSVDNIISFYQYHEADYFEVTDDV